MLNEEQRDQLQPSKETSSRVSTIAAGLTNFSPPDLIAIVDSDEPDIIAEHCEKVRTLAACALSQDETPGQEKVSVNFFDRLKNEREDLDTRLIALNSYLTNNPGHPNARHRPMLVRQAELMSELLAVLDERICDLAIGARSTEDRSHNGMGHDVEQAVGSEITDAE